MNALKKYAMKAWIKVIKALNLSRPNFFESKEVPSEFFNFLTLSYFDFYAEEREMKCKSTKKCLKVKNKN